MLLLSSRLLDSTQWLDVSQGHEMLVARGTPPFPHRTINAVPSAPSNNATELLFPAVGYAQIYASP